LCERLRVDAARMVWLGDLKINWGFRQVLDGSEIPLPRS